MEDSRELKQLHHINCRKVTISKQESLAVATRKSYFIAQVSRSVVQYLKLEPCSRYRLGIAILDTTAIPEPHMKGQSKVAMQLQHTQLPL